MTNIRDIAIKILGLIDLTSLNDNDTNNTIIALCNKAKTQYGPVPAICIYSRYIPLARATLNRINPDIKIATVTNFPHGSSDIDLALYETKLAVNRGADEVDLVFPYHYLKNGDSALGQQMVAEAKKICGSKVLKVIIESGELKTPELIKWASDISIEAGADFIKTSTGKVAINATLEATEIMLNCIKASGKKCGFKAAGGIKSVAEAGKYLGLTAKIMGNAWINPNNFRFGASSLLNDVLNVLDGKAGATENINVY
ncbi:MAG: deoxyribose-phosphate aldolase [Burkholderiales bacterium]|jgi:deoxyribose-phosphate aldolase|nr:deoxyribose-phosphate aldolase [Burkholderiales bacterium]